MTRRPRLAVVVTVALGVLATGCSSGAGEANDERPVTTTTALVSDTRRDGVPDESGARAAAIAHSSASQHWMYLDDAGVEAAVEEIATRTSADRLAAEVVDEVRVARESLMTASGRVWWLVRPLATKVESFRGESARVAVWIVTILSASDVAMPQSDWRTLTLELRWDAGAWRVDDIDDRPGPTPMLGPRDRAWTPEELDRALDGFERVMQ